MDYPDVIALCGLAGSGKSTIADHLVAKHGYTRVKFSGPLKDMLRAIGLDEDEIEGSKKELPCDLLLGRTPRHAMITLGTEWGRQLIGADLWTHLWRERVAAVLNSGSRVVVDDMRFPNESVVAREMGAKLVRVYREGLGAGTHESERYANSMDVDWSIINDGTIEQLVASMDHALSQGLLV